MSPDQKTPQKNVAFALGGLAGNNAHGAGFLYAALRYGINPQSISCTSGQIRTTHHYLKALEDSKKTSKEQAQAFHRAFLEDYKKSRPTGEANLDLGLLMLRGFPGVFRPAYESMALDIVSNGIRGLANNSYGQLTHTHWPLMMDQIMNWSTNRTLTPLTVMQSCQDIADTFNRSEIQLCFNAYDPLEGKEYVYFNKAAEAARQASRKSYQKVGYTKTPKSFRVECAIDATAVRDALWLYAYGLNSKDNPRIDGAFFREIMLRELVEANLIISVRPINHRWKGSALPDTYQATEDLKTEVGFDGSYSAERDNIHLINKLLATKLLTPPPSGPAFHHIDLHELEISIPRGYYDYALESYEVYDQAHHAALRAFKMHKLTEQAFQAPPPPPNYHA